MSQDLNLIIESFEQKSKNYKYELFLSSVTLYGGSTLLGLTLLCFALGGVGLGGILITFGYVGSMLCGVNKFRKLDKIKLKAVDTVVLPLLKER